MRRVGIAFLALIVTSGAPLAQNPPLLLCAVNGIETRAGAGIQPHEGNYVGLQDWGNAINLVAGNDDVVLPIVNRRNGWLLTAERQDKDGGSTTLHLVNLPEFDGITMLLALKAPSGRVTIRASCKPN